MFAVLDLHNAWAELQHAGLTQSLAASDRVLYQAANAARFNRGQIQASLLAVDDPRSTIDRPSVQNNNLVRFALPSTKQVACAT